MTTRAAGRVLPEFADDFDGPALDTSVWVPHYLPAWSSRAATAAAYELRDSALHLRIPPDHPVWCPGDHTPPLRVSGIQSGTWSGPVGSTEGQQPFRTGQTVREAQAMQWGWTPHRGRVAMQARAAVTSRSMVSLWMVGLEDVPERCAEICIMEVFGDAVDPGVSTGVGSGLHRFRDPGAHEDFAVVRRPIDVADVHVYAVDWRADRIDVTVDGEHLRSCPDPPDYPMQLMLAVFDFPERSQGDDDVVPELVVDWVRGADAPSFDDG